MTSMGHNTDGDGGGSVTSDTTTKTDSQTIHIDLGEFSSTSSESSASTDDEGGLGDEEEDDDDNVQFLMSTTSVDTPNHRDYISCPIRNLDSSPSSKPVQQVSACNNTTVYDTADPCNVSLLERIVRTHPIWYLPHVSRTAAAHLLRPMEPGVFIVRASSKSTSMALSIRLPIGHTIDTDHYLIESIGISTIRLEGSPFTFASLPQLLEHYCLHGEELQTKLTLPAVICNCSTRMSLQSYGLMGQDFWTSELSISAPQQQLPTSSRIASGHHSGASDSSSSTTNKRRSPSKIITRPSRLPIATITVDRSSPPIKPARQSIGGSSLKKSQSASEGLKLLPRYYGQTTVDTTAKKSFKLRQFLFGDSNNHSSSCSNSTIIARNNNNQTIDNNDIKYPIVANRLANCDYFTPPSHVATVSSSQSAYTLSTTQPNDQMSPKFDRQLRTFKPTNIDNIGGSQQSIIRSVTTINNTSTLVKPPLKPKPILRRERSDLGPTAVVACRLATHTERSPAPSDVVNAGKSPPLPPHCSTDVSMKSCVDELRMKRLESNTNTICSSNNMLSSNGQQRRYFDQTFNKKDGSAHVIMRSSSRNNQHNDDIKSEHRLSAPNIAENLLLGPNHKSVLLTAKALTAKLGRTPGTGELQTINEGLITPVVRRKQFFGRRQPKHSPPLQPTFGEYKRESANFDDVIDNGVGTTTGGGFTRRYCSERSSRVKHVIGNTASSTINGNGSTTITAQAIAWRPTSHSRRGDITTVGEKFTNNKNVFPSRSTTWSAVNNELKSRQKIAKVRPTPNPNVPMIGRQSSTNSLTMTNGHSSSASLRIPTSSSTNVRSEYAQLSEFTEILFPNRKSNDRDTVLANQQCNDDDNVSMAGTVFNEPWDSNVWENLLDLAHYGDDKPSCSTMTNIIGRRSDCSTTGNGRLITPATINEEDEDENGHCEYGSINRCGGDNDDHKQQQLGSRAWHDMSTRIPSETSSNQGTYDSRKSSSLASTMIDIKPESKSRTNKSDDNTMISSSNLFNVSPVTSPARLRQDGRTDPGSRIQDYVERLGRDEAMIFGATLRRFIECTIEAEECDPQVVIRNVRQFLNGIKNYLVKHGEAQLHELIEAERSRLNANEFLNIDAILEAVLHKIVLEPVKPHLYHLMVREHSKNGSLKALSENLVRVRSLSPTKFGFNNDKMTITPNSNTMESIKGCLRKMQHHYSPIKKLENLLRAVSLAIGNNHSTNGSNENSDPQKRSVPTANELVRWLVYLLAKTSTVGCEVEAWYMWELLPQQLLTSGDASYYLTALFSAVHVLKHSECIDKLANMNDENDDTNDGVLTKFETNSLLSHDLSVLPGHNDHSTDAFIKIAVLNEQAGSIQYQKFPGVPQMTTGKLCRVIAHQFGVTNPEDHGLYLLVDGFETCLLANECPDNIRDQLRSARKQHLFAYKRHEAKIAWPKVAMTAK